MTETNVIIGAGQAGGWAAMAMRQTGFTGRIRLIGAEPWQPYERPPLSKAMLAGAEEPPLQYFHDPARYAAQEIELTLGRAAEAVEPAAQTVRLTDGARIGFDRLLLATGGRARSLPVPGGERALLLRTVEDARALRARLATAGRVVCIGAGVIGLEIAASARARRCDVTVLEAAAHPMGRCVSPEGARFIAGLHERAGVILRCSVAVEAIEAAPGGGERVICADGTVVEADLIVAGVGMQRELGLAEHAGLIIEGGIAVDELGRTSAPGIYAAGDAAAFLHPFYNERLRLESWRHAQNHGVAVGRTMAGTATAYDDIPWFWTDQHGVNVQVAGLPDRAARTVVRVDEVARFVAVHLGADDSAVAVTAAGSPRDIRAGTALIRSRRPLDPLLLADPAVPLQSLP